MSSRPEFRQKETKKTMGIFGRLFGKSEPPQPRQSEHPSTNVAGCGAPSVSHPQSEPIQRVATLVGHSGPISAIEFDPNKGILVSAGSDRVVRFWAVPGGNRLAALTGHPNYIMCASISGDGALVATGGSTSRGSSERLPSQPTCFVWRVSPPGLVGSFRGATYATTIVALSQKGDLLATGDADGSVRLWNPTALDCLATIDHHKNNRRGVNRLLFGNAGRVLVTADQESHKICITDVKTQALVSTVDIGHGSDSLVMSPDTTKIAEHVGRGEVRIWSVPEGAPVACLKHAMNGSPWFCFHPDGERFLMAAPDGVGIWNIAGQELERVITRKAGVGSLAVSRTGRLLANRKASETEILEFETGALLEIVERPARVFFGLHDELIAVEVERKSGPDDNAMFLWYSASPPGPQAEGAGAAQRSPGNPKLAMVEAIQNDDHPAMIALARQDPELARSFVYENRPLLYVAIQKRLPELVGLLIQQGVDIHARSILHCTPLHFAAEIGDAGCLDLLIQGGARIDDRDPPDPPHFPYPSVGGKTPLAVAVDGQHLPAVQLLLKAGANPNIDYGSDENILREAAAKGCSAEIVGALLDAGARVTSNKDGWTALHYACRAGSPKMVEALLKAGAAIDAKNKFGDTPLHRAAGDETTQEARESKAECARILCERGAPLESRNNRGKTPYEAALANDMHEVAAAIDQAAKRAKGQT
jgi:ankyrin repeat protein/WD40 repeat protein